MSEAVDRKSSDRLIGRLTNGERTPLKRTLVMCVIIAAWLALAAPAIAQAFERKYEFRIEEETLGSALDAIVQQTELVILYPYELAEQAGVNSVIGQYTVREALEVMLRDTQFSGGLTEGGVMFVSLSGDQTTIDREGTVNSGKVKRGLLASVSAFMFGAGGQALAQNDEAADNLGRDTIVVTAQKREQRLQDVPISLNVLGEAEIADRGIAGLQDLGLVVPSLTVRDLGDQRQIAVRGVDNNNGPTPLTGVYIDELPANGGQSGFGFDLPDLRLYDLERVEVLKGPQGTLFGQGSVGGTVRFITKKPDLNQVQIKANVELAATKDGGASQTFQGALSIPLIEDKLAVRISPTWDYQGGWIDQPTAAAENVNDSNVVNVRTNVLWRPTSDLQITGMAIIHQTDAGGLSRGEDEDGTYLPELFLPGGGTIIPTRTEDYELFNVTLEYDLGRVSVLSSSSYSDRDAVASPLYSPGFVFRQPYSSEVFSQEIRLTSVDDARLSWVVGGVYNDVESQVDAELWFSDPGSLSLPSAPAPDFATVQATTSESWAVFGDANYDVTDRFELGVGLRYFEDERTFFDGTPNAAGFDELTPRFYASYDFSDNITAYVNVAKGFRSGGFNAAGGAPFDPETVWTYDVGARGSLLNGRLYIDVSGYYSDYQNYLADSTVPGALQTTFNNLGEVEIIGGELSANWQATDSLMLSFSANYTDAEVSSTGGATDGQFLDGDPVNAISPFGFTATLKQDFVLGGYNGYFRLDLNHQDGMENNDRRFGGRFTETDDVDILNADLGFDLSEDFRLSFFARNVLDERDAVYNSGSPAFNPRARPRTLGVRLGYEM